MKRTLIILLMFSGLLKLFGCKGQRDKKQDDPKMEQIGASTNDFKNRLIYKKLTKEILESVPDHRLEQIIFDNISQIIGYSRGNEFQSVQELTRGQQAIYSTWMVEAEVNNGGFNQFYFNSSGQFAQMAVEGFETFKAVRFADLMRRANELHWEIKDDYEEYNDGTPESFSKSFENNPLNDLDAEFYDLYKTEPLNSLKVTYIRNNVDDFIKR